MRPQWLDKTWHGFGFPSEGQGQRACANALAPTVGCMLLQAWLLDNAFGVTDTRIGFGFVLLAGASAFFFSFFTFWRRHA